MSATNWLIEPIRQNGELFAMVFALIIMVLLVSIVLLLRRGLMDIEVSVNLDSQIEQLRQAAQHHADVSAVVTMVRQLEELDEDAVELLQSYPESVRAAAWLHYINTLGSDLRAAQEYLSKQHRTYPDDHLGLVSTAQSRVDRIRRKLDEAIEASGQTGLRVV